MVRTAVYWKNGTLIPLIGQGIDSYVKQMQLIGNDLYVLGGFDDPTEGWVIGYWKNGEFHALPKERKPEVYEFHVTDAGDLYAVGYDRLKAVYWENDELFRMESVTSYAYGMWLDGEDLHVVGTRYISGIGMVGAYWKNGTIVSELNGGTFYSVCVDDGKVYLLGMETVGSEEDGTEREVPFYQVDGERYRLSEEKIVQLIRSGYSTARSSVPERVIISRNGCRKM